MESVTFKSAVGTEITAYCFKPPGEGPFPMIIAMHGCGGLCERGEKSLSANRMDWANRFMKAGYFVLFPDSYEQRGFTSVCEIKPDKQIVMLRDHVGDLSAP